MSLPSIFRTLHTRVPLKGLAKDGTGCSMIQDPPSYCLLVYLSGQAKRCCGNKHP